MACYFLIQIVTSNRNVQMLLTKRVQKVDRVEENTVRKIGSPVSANGPVIVAHVMTVSLILTQ